MKCDAHHELYFSDPKVRHLLSHECCITRACSVPILVGSELWWVVKIKSKQRGKTSVVSLENELVEPPGSRSMAAEATLEFLSCCEFSFFSRPFSVHMKALQTQWGFCCNNNNRVIPKVAGMGILFSNSFILCEVSKEGNCFLLSDVGGGDLGTGGGFPSPFGLGGWGKDQGHYFPFALVSVQMHPELTEQTKSISFQCLFKWMLFKTIHTSKNKEYPVWMFCKTKGKRPSNSQNVVLHIVWKLL